MVRKREIAIYLGLSILYVWLVALGFESTSFLRKSVPYRQGHLGPRGHVVYITHLLSSENSPPNAKIMNSVLRYKFIIFKFIKFSHIN